MGKGGYLAFPTYGAYPLRRRKRNYIYIMQFSVISLFDWFLRSKATVSVFVVGGKAGFQPFPTTRDTGRDRHIYI